MFRVKAVCLLAVAAIGLCFMAQALAQEATSRPARDRGQGRGGFQNMTPEERTARMEEFKKQADKQLQESLGATDEEFKALQPKIEKVQKLQRDQRGGFGGFAMPGGGRGRGGRDGATPPPADATPPADAPQLSEVQKAKKALSDAIKNKDAKAEDVKKALADYRAAKTKAKEELTKAQKELQEVVTPKQEAVLVDMNILE